MSHPSTTDWHIPEADLLSYADEQSSDAHAWSIESHLPGCAICRQHLNAALATPELSRELARARHVVRSAVAPPDSATSTVTAPLTRPSRGHSAALVAVSRTFIGRIPGLLTVLGIVLLAVAADLGWRYVTADSPRRFDSLMMLIGPVLPLAGVALACSKSSDPCAEITLSTPSAGLRMVLWRTLAVLVVATPLTTALGMATGAVSATALLLPTLAITVATLALGSRTGLDIAAAIVAAAWILLVAMPSLAATRMVLPVYAESALWWWIAALALGAVITLWQRDGFERIPRIGIRRAGGQR
ncbi:MAG: hypothetical protein WA880_16500 [Ornithinimicrobium sp.]